MTVSAAATDGDLATLAYEPRDPADGTVLHRVSRGVSGSSASETVELWARGTTRRDSYRTVVTAADATGASAVDSRDTTL